MEEVFEMIVPDNCLPWIKLQRHPVCINNQQYIDIITKEFNLMLPFLPVICNKILDIGCGVAGIDVLLSEEYSQPEIYLLDSNHRSTNNIVYGFDHGEFYYNSFLATNDMMVQNGISKYHIMNLNTGLVNIDNNSIDIVISLLSCGYHYPVEKYLTEINRILSRDGVLIIDVRENTDGIDKIKKLLPDIKIISTYNKSNRIRAKRKQYEKT